MKYSEPAFPIPNDGSQTGGLSKREYFAARALQALLSYGERGSSSLGLQAVCYADSLIKALQEQPVESPV
jgi:hypothetical protein